MKPQAHTPGAQIAGYEVVSLTPIPDIHVTALRLRHVRTGAEHIHLECADDNNLFGVTFRTPSADSTGAAHILEHTVLCGSEKFPVRDPFFSMIKRSLSTFMNALTSDDWTMYPFSSRNRKDFFNLLDVYLDAAFFPLIKELDFSQEGHRFDFEPGADGKERLVYKGVVYNEMKGAMSDPRSLLGHRMAAALFPTTPYGHNAGGDPAEIPKLTWQGLRAFHARYYHPSNARFFTYGNIPVEETLSFIERRVLNRFDRLAVDSSVAAEPRFPQPVRKEEPYPVAPGQETGNRSMFLMAWRTCSLVEPFEVLAMRILSALLLGNPAAPLHKALLDSRLGAQLAPGTGFNDDIRETVLGAGLQGIRREDGGRVEELILSTLENLSRTGFSKDRIEAAMHRLEFSNREIVGDHFPYPLLLLFRMIGAWNHDGDPCAPLLIAEPFERLRREVAAGPFFENLIRKYLLDNPHRVSLTLYPDAEGMAREEEKVRRELDAIDGRLTDEDRTEIRTRAAALEKEQEKEHDLSPLPTLEISDIDPKADIPETRVARDSGRTIQTLETPTNGITYASLYLDATTVPEPLLPWVPVFSACLTQVGAAGRSYTEMAERMEAHTGGISASADALESGREIDRLIRFIEIRGKALDRNVEELFSILEDIVLSPDFSDLDRLKTLVGQVATNLENSIPQSGHRYAAGRAAGRLTAGGALRETWRGLEMVRRMKALAAAPDTELKKLSERLTEIAGHLKDRAAAVAGLTAEAGALEKAEKRIKPLLGGLSSSGWDAGAIEKPFEPGEGIEGWASSLPVSYVARVFRTVPYDHPDTAALLVLAKLLRFGYLHREIREKGGAYGGMAAASMTGGTFSLMSYRDPHFTRTLGVYRDAVAWAASGGFTDENIREGILGVFSDLDGVLSPEGLGLREFRYRLQGITPAMRQRLRDRILSVTRADIVAAAERNLGRPGVPSAIAGLSNRAVLDQVRNESGLEAMVIEEV